MSPQTKWRIAGAVCIIIAAAMAFGGAQIDWEAVGIRFMIIYWLLFMLAFVAALYCAVVDIKYINLQYAADKRAAFRETLGSEEFRKALREAHESQEENSRHNPSNN